MKSNYIENELQLRNKARTVKESASRRRQNAVEVFTKDLDC